MDEVNCEKCGYDLRGHDGYADCPECGMPVAGTLACREHRRALREQLRNRRGRDRDVLAAIIFILLYGLVNAVAVGITDGGGRFLGGQEMMLRVFAFVVPPAASLALIGYYWRQRPRFRPRALALVLVGVIAAALVNYASLAQ